MDNVEMTLKEKIESIRRKMEDLNEDLTHLEEAAQRDRETAAPTQK